MARGRAEVSLIPGPSPQVEKGDVKKEAKKCIFSLYYYFYSIIALNGN